MEATIEAAWTAARAAWPDVALDRAGFAAFVGDRAPDGAVEGLHLEHMFLAGAAAAGDARAIARVDAEFIGRLGPSLATFARSGVQPDEVMQLVRVRLFTGEDGRRPRIAEYSGIADLGTWIRVVALRLAISLGRMHRREIAIGDEALAGAPDAAPSPELALLKRTYQAEFAAAFAAGFRGLEPRQRNLLRHQVFDQLSIDRIGSLYGVHRATAARWLAQAREDLEKAVRKHLQAALKIDREALDSILRMLQSELDVSMRVFLSQA